MLAQPTPRAFLPIAKDETLVAFGTMNDIVYAISLYAGWEASLCGDLYETYIWDCNYWRSIVVTYTLDDALYRLDNVTGRLANLNQCQITL